MAAVGGIASVRRGIPPSPSSSSCLGPNAGRPQAAPRQASREVQASAALLCASGLLRPLHSGRSPRGKGGRRGAAWRPATAASTPAAGTEAIPQASPPDVLGQTLLPRSASFEALAAWVTAKGGFVSDALGELDAEACGSGGRGLAARRDLKPGELLARIPLSLVLRPSGPDLAVVALQGEEELEPLAPYDCALALALVELQEQRQHSQWWTYLRHVGFPCQGLPLLCSEEELLALQSPSLAGAVRKVREAGRKLAEGQAMPEAAVLCALQLVRTRRFSVAGRSMLVPVIDLLNHSFHPQVEVAPPADDFVIFGEAAVPEQEEEDAFRLRAKVEVKRGEELTWEYCQDSNDLLLSTHGFIVPGNPFDRLVARPADMRKALQALAEASGASGLLAEAKFTELRERLPDPPSEGQGLVLLEKLGGADPIWNPDWLELCWFMRLSGPGEPHWSSRPDGPRLLCAAVAKAVEGLRGMQGLAAEEERLLAQGCSAGLRVALQFRREQARLAEAGLAHLRKELGVE